MPSLTVTPAAARAPRLALDVVLERKRDGQAMVADVAAALDVTTSLLATPLKAAMADEHEISAAPSSSTTASAAAGPSCAWTGELRAGVAGPICLCVCQRVRFGLA